MKKILILFILPLFLVACTKVRYSYEIENKRIDRGFLFSNYIFVLKGYGEYKVDYDTYYDYKIGDIYSWSEYK